MRILDVRHEQTAVFAAEAVGKLTRTPGLAVLTAGPGVTNGVSAVTQARFSGSPLVVVGGRAPANRWGTGSLQELDHPPLLAPVTKLARTVHSVGRVADARRRGVHAGRLLAPRTGLPRRPDGPVLRHGRPSTARPSARAAAAGARPGRARAGRRAARPRRARPVLVLGTDVWADGAEEAALRLVEETGVPVITNGMGRGVVPGGHPLLVTKARGTALRRRRPGRRGRHARSTSGSATASSAARTARPRPRVVHLADSPGQVSRHADARRRPRPATSPLVLDGLQAALEAQPRRPDWSAWVDRAAGRGRARPPSATPRCCAQGRPDPPGAHLRRAGPPPRRRRGRDRRRRRLRVLRRQVRRAEAPRRLARPRPLRLPRRRPRLRDRRPARPPLGAGRAAARRRRRRHVADGRRHPRAPRPAGRDGLRQQLRVGPGEGPDADALRLRRRGRPRPADPLRRGREGARRWRRDRDRPGPDRSGPRPRVRVRRRPTSST